MRKQSLWFVIGAVLAVNAIVWLLFIGMQNAQKTENKRTNYPFLSARIFADNPNDILINFVPLRKNLEAKFAALPAGTKYSFYFEYLPSGTSIRIGDDKELIAASLIKVPLVMNLYRAAELKKLDLDQVVTIQQDELDDSYGDLWEQGAGTQLSLRQLAKLTLEQSDNTASHAIYNHTKDLLAEEDQSLAQLDVDQNTQDGQAVINAKSYASVLKSLYLASYINRDSSNEILSYLTNSTETNRLTKNIPVDVKVAHKNGVYNQDWSESDCGIVYAKSRPYSICVMVGLPENEANAFIATVSKDIYNFVTAQP